MLKGAIALVLRYILLVGGSALATVVSLPRRGQSIFASMSALLLMPWRLVLLCCLAAGLR